MTSQITLKCMGVFFITAVLTFFLLKKPEDGVYGFDLDPVFHGFLIIGNVIFHSVL